MARGSGSSGDSSSYREWAAAQKDRERRERQADKDRLAAEAVARDEEAAAKTEAVERRVAELESLPRSSLTRDARISFDSLRSTATVPPLDLGSLANPIPAPQWEGFAPEPPNVLRRMLGDSQRYQASCEAAERAFASAQADHQQQEAARQRMVAEARAAWNMRVVEAKRKADAHNAHVAEMAVGFREHDRFAVSEYVQIVLDRSPTPKGSLPSGTPDTYPSRRCWQWSGSCQPSRSSPSTRRSSTSRRVKPSSRPGGLRPTRNASTTPSSPRSRYARSARYSWSPRTTWSAQSSSTGISTPSIRLPVAGSGRRSSRCAPPEKSSTNSCSTEPRFDPVASIRRHFFAAISQHPEEFKPVEPVMPFSRADPRVIEAIDVISTLDQRPNLLDLTFKEFESFVQNLFTKMGYETDQFRASGDGGIDCMAYKRDPVAPMKIAVQAKLYTKTVSPTHVRDLYGTMQHEGATLGIMITTSGYGPGSVEFANGKPLHLIDGPGLISICQEHGIPARILGLGTRKRKP